MSYMYVTKEPCVVGTGRNTVSLPEGVVVLWEGDRYWVGASRPFARHSRDTALLLVAEPASSRSLTPTHLDGGFQWLNGFTPAQPVAAVCVHGAARRL